jgi:hypothetical protein
VNVGNVNGVIVSTMLDNDAGEPEASQPFTGPYADQAWVVTAHAEDDDFSCTVRNVATGASVSTHHTAPAFSTAGYVGLRANRQTQTFDSIAVYGLAN